MKMELKVEISHQVCETYQKKMLKKIIYMEISMIISLDSNVSR